MSRIAFVSETWAPEINGVAHTLGHLADHLASRGFELQLIRPKPRDGALDSNMSAELHSFAIPIPDYEGVSMGIPMPLKLRRLWKEQRPDVVYIATEGPLGLSAQRAARHLDIPVVSGFHTNFDQYSTHYIMLKLLRPLVRPYLRRFHNRTAITLVPTQAQANTLTAWGYCNVQVMSRGLDCRHFSPARRDMTLRTQWQADESRPVALYVGRLAAEKNMDLLIKTFEAMRQRHPALIAVLVGDGPQRQHLERRLPWAIFAGFQRGETLARYYASADIFVFPSLSETFGNVVTEAMASGLAIVAFDYAAAGELVEHGIEGYLVPTDNANSFIDAAASLCDDVDMIKQFGAAARKKVEPLEWHRIGDTFVNYLHQAQEVGDGRSHISRI
ncbi:glycosyltransferase family 4 protein [Phytohalomonas tamaricis]|uniref:glycosyltransferase family 4 protein n=1 Tax=Phytohalomonas tamaricis TaxID=2081032 RepID=UPI000D0BCBF7|nr:glycosyltransferase family 1 protein [Phytohalomonas tamaricis]